MPLIPLTEYQQRRQRFAANLAPNSIAIFPGATAVPRNGDGDFPFRQNSDFYYLTGFNEPDAIAILLSDGNNTRYILFNQPNDPLMETWHGHRTGQEGAKHIYGADVAYPIEKFAEQLPELLQGRDILYFAFGRQMHWDRKIQRAINDLRAKVRTGVTVPQTIINPEQFLHEMRLQKSPAEIAVMRKVAQISVAAHQRTMQTCQPGHFEYELQAMITETFLRHGCQNYAYYPIIASGPNSCTLHYHENNRQLQQNDIILIDAGAELENYASDITRTFPANKKFTAEQRAIYEIVLRTQLAIIDQVKPGLRFNQMQEIAIKILTEGLIDIGLLKGKTEDLIAQKAYLPFYMHLSGHWLGLDTHDVGSYKVNNAWRELMPGMVITVEPGIYIAPQTPNVDARWWGIGVRIEDDVLITDLGTEVLSAGLAKTVEDVEQLRG